MAEHHHPDKFAAALTGVYATDPNYGANLISLMRRYDLYRYSASDTGPPDRQPGRGAAGQRGHSRGVWPADATGPARWVREPPAATPQPTRTARPRADPDREPRCRPRTATPGADPDREPEPTADRQPAAGPDREPGAHPDRRPGADRNGEPGTSADA